MRSQSGNPEMGSPAKPENNETVKKQRRIPSHSYASHLLQADYDIIKKSRSNIYFKFNMLRSALVLTATG
jgi:hypothetical protein